MPERIVKVRLSAAVQEYVANMKAAASATKDVADAGVTSAPALTSAFSKIKSGASQMGAEIKRASSTSEWRQVATTMTVVGGAVTAVGIAAMRTGVQYNQMQQSTRAALTTLLGSAKAANEQMDKLDTFARTSPFSKATFIQAQQQMLAFGIETKKVIPYLDAVQNAVAASGGSNADIAGLIATMSKIKSSAKVTATDLMEFGNRGVDAAGLIGQAMGKTGAQIRADITAGTLDADAALDALTRGMSSKFGGAADNVKNTFSGAMDRVSAAWRDFSAELARPLVDPNGGGALVDLLNWSADALRNFEKLPEPVRNTATGIAGIAGAGTLAVGSMMLLAPKAMETYEAFQKLSDLMPRTSSALSTFGKVGAGAIVGITAAAAAGDALTEWVRSFGDEAEVTGNKVKTAASATDLMLAGAKSINSNASLKLAGNQLRVLGDALDEVRRSGQDGLFQAQAINSVTALGAELGRLAGTDLPAAQRQFALLVEGGRLTESQQQKLLEKMGPYKKALIEQATAAGEAATGQDVLGRATGGTVPNTEEATAAAEGFADAVKTAEGHLTDMSDALDDVAGTALGMGDAVDKAQSSLNKMAEAAEGEEASLYGTNDASIKLRDSMREVEKSHRDAADAILQNGGSVEDAMGKWTEGRQRIIDMRMAMGESADEAAAWADKNLGSSEQVKKALDGVASAVRNIPTKPVVDISITGSSAVYNELMSIQSALRAVTGDNRIRVATGAGGQGGLVAGNYQGGIYDKGVKAFYSGGFASGIYAGVRGGIHKFAESEMGVPWETYISGRAADRDRNIGIWQETGRRLGAYVGYGSGVGPTVTIRQDIHPSQRMSEAELARIVAEKTQFAFRGA